jgi:glutathione reductase (NADPH)
MFNLANFMEDTHLFKDYGVDGLDSVKIDYATFKKNRDAYIDRLHAIYHKNVAGSQVEYMEGTAKFLGKKEVQVSGKDSNTILTADHVMIASGSQSIEAPSIVGSEHCITSDGIFEMETLPKSMVIIGGGYIGTEIAGIMNAFGVETTLLVKDLMLGRVDQEVVDLVIENMRKQGVNIMLKTQTTKITKCP